MANLPKLTAVPAARSRANVLRARLVLVLGTLIFTSAMGLVATFAWLSNKPEKVDLSAVSPASRALAEAAAKDFLAGKSFSVPVASGLEQYAAANAGNPAFPYQTLAWESFYVRPYPNVGSMETHNFLVTYQAVNAENETVYRQMRLTASIVVPAAAQDASYLASLPTLSAYAPTAKPGEGLYYTTTSGVAFPAGASEAVRDWAAAYAADDTKTLQQLSGDTEPGFVYHGIGGFTVSNVNILSTFATDKSGDAWIVQVRLQLTGPGGFSRDAEVELSVVDARAATPRVQAWGAIGAGFLPARTNRVPA